LPVKRKPIINYLVDLFLQEGIGDIFVLISKDFREEFNWWKKRYYPKNKIQFVEESKPLGTFGGLWYLKNKLSSSPFFLTNGDELKKINLKEMIDFHQRNKISATIALVRVPNPQDYGVVLTQSNLVFQFLEKPENPPSKYISSGLYVLSPEIFNYHPGPKFSMIETDLFPKLAKEGKLAGFKFNGRWMDCGTWERYEKALRYWK
jgi:NDP-sugar pyrophosphorylase family protein